MARRSWPLSSRVALKMVFAFTITLRCTRMKSVASMPWSTSCDSPA